MVEFGLPRALQPAIALRRRMAGARRRSTSRAGSGYSAELCGRAARRAAARVHVGGRRLAQRGALALGLFLTLACAQAQVISTRIWPAKEYTRVTFESKTELKFQLFAVKNPERLVLDLEGVDLGPALAELDGKVATGDPYIDKLRVGRNRPGVVRVVIDLKAEVKPQLFTLKPVGEYGHRVVLDLYPMVAPDPLAALIEADGKMPKLLKSEKEQAPLAERPKVA